MSKVICSCCGSEIDDDNYYEVEDCIVCEDCYDDSTFTCDCCGDRYFNDNAYGDGNTSVCRNYYENEYHRCERCNCLLHDDDVLWQDDYPYCQSCYDDISDDFINEYSYKPDPIFHRCPDEKRIRYYGVELEIDDSYLYDYCNMFGISEEELMLLYEMGYDDEEIELMMMDNDMLRKCLDEAKEMVGIYA